MWKNPRHYPESPAPSPPAEQGERLATFARGDGVELRLCRAEYNGHAYFSLRIWERDRAGRWWPSKGRGVSVRMGEAAGLAAALAGLGR